MGDPTEPGEDQEATIIIEGPPNPPDDASKAAFADDFTKFKDEVKALYKKYPRLKIRLRRIEVVKKAK